ncbi:MAG: SDR family oxidoreductase [Planctomycetaceae bacterium]|nr:SDR family oxidoreductase [Planctomycetaceae bacterium]
MDLKDKTVVITGGGSGIGAAIAIGLAELGTRVVIAGRDLEKLQKVCKLHPEHISAIATDVANRESSTELINQATNSLGQIDVLINSAGTNVPNRMMHNLDPADWDKMMGANATGAFNCIREVLPQMRQRKDGVIINISSISGLRAAALGGVGYNASKFAISGLGMSVGDEVREEGIRVTNIYPGEVDTPILANRPSPVSDEHRAKILKPEDVAATVLMVLNLPPRARVPELTIMPTVQSFV